MPTVSPTPPTVRQSGRKIKAPTYLGDEVSPNKVKAFVPTHVLIGKSVSHGNKVGHVADESTLVEQPSPVSGIAKALMEEEKEVGLVFKPQEDPVSSLVGLPRIVLQ